MEMGFVALGLVQGALAGINALGLVLLWRTTRVVNLAQPAMGLVGGVLTGMLVAEVGWSFWWAAPVGIVVGALLGLASERLVLVRLQDLPRAVLLVATVGLAQIFGALQSAIPFILGGRLPSYDVNLFVPWNGAPVEWFLFPVLLKGPHLLALASFPIIVFLLWRFVHRSRLGVAAVALGQDVERARSLGVPAGFVRSVAWSVAGALSAVSGILSIPVLGFSLGDGVAPTVLLLALAPAVLAGLRSLTWTALASLTIGVGYQFALVNTSRAGYADLVLVGAVILGVALQRRRLARAEEAATSASWEAATSARPLPWDVVRRTSWRVATRLGALVLLVAAVLPPLVLSPSDDVLYGTSAAITLAAVAVAVAWMFAGEIALGHWGLAAAGAALTAVLPGPVAVRMIVAALVVGAVGVAMAFVARRRAGLAFAVVGLAIAVAAPVAMLEVGQARLGTDAEVAGMVAAGIAVLATVLVLRLRGSRLGARLVAARDDANRAPWLGVSPFRMRVVALGLSGMLAGAAGALYLASVPAGLAPGAFDPDRSLDVLALAIVGGLGSPLGAMLGAAGLLFAKLVLPGPWGQLASGAGVLLVVLFLPSGLGRGLTILRDLAARILAGHDPNAGRVDPAATSLSKQAAVLAAAEAALADVDPDDAEALERLDDQQREILALTAGDPGRLSRVSRAEIVDLELEDSEDEVPGAMDIVAGSDTREALTTLTVRSGLVAAFLLASPAIAAAFAIPRAVTDHLSIGIVGLAPWITMVGLALFAGAAALSWRRPMDPASKALPPEMLAAAAGAIFSWAVVLLGDPVLGTLAMPVGILAGGFAVGRLARTSTMAVAPVARTAATGLIATGALAGGLGAGHLCMVASGSGILRAFGWTAVYLLLGTVALGRVRHLLRADWIRAESRAQQDVLLARTWDDVVGKPALRVDRLSVDFGATRVLDDVSLVVRPGEMVALVGGNGAGKSTMLRAAAGFAPTSAGRIGVVGEDVTALRPEERAQSGLAFVAGSRPVFPDLTVRENLRVGAYQTHRSATAFNEATEHVLHLVPAVARRLRTRCSMLSGGERRLLAVAQTLYRRPEVLLADEITLGLDVDARHAVLDLLRVLADDGVAVVVVDHDLPALLPRCDRAVLLHDGESTDFDRPTDVLEQRADLLPATFLAGVNG